MTLRYYVTEPILRETATLTGPEAHHLLHVMRARRGDEVILFDGSGDQFPARVETLGRSGAELAILGRESVDREVPCPLILGVALPKGDRQHWLVEKAVELGVTTLVPLETARSVAPPSAKVIDRLGRAVIEASKQCGRNRLMKITAAQIWRDFLASTADSPIRLLAHPSSESQLPELPASMPGTTVIAVGPEGGFSNEEVTQATERGWHPITLGPRILRIETAAIALAALVAMRLEGGHNRLL